jgi:hypothetical protein
LDAFVYCVRDDTGRPPAKAAAGGPQPSAAEWLTVSPVPDGDWLLYAGDGSDD